MAGYEEKALRVGFTGHLPKPLDSATFLQENEKYLYRGSVMTGDKILVVDDEAYSRTLSKTILEKNGYQVVQASNGKEALRKAETEKPDLILLDIVMPDMTGFDVCKRLRKQQKTRFIPIIMFSALSRDVDRKMSKAAGANALVSKSSAPKSLISEVKIHLDAIRPRKFSVALGLSHEEMKGRKILFEFDPTTHYERCIRDFTVEAQAHGEAVIIMTAKGSSLYKTFKEEKAIEILPLSADTVQMSWINLEKHFDQPFTLIYDNLSDLSLNLGFNEVYTFTRNTLERLFELSVTALFLLNPEAHDRKEISSFHSLFSDQVRCGKEGLTKIRLF